MFIKSGQANISDISEIKSSQKNNPDTGIFSRRACKPLTPNESRRGEKKRGILFEYIYARKYYMLALCVVYILGVAVGALLANNLERAEIINLSMVVDNYFTDLPAIDMTARIFGNIAVNLLFIFGAYLCGVTVFAPILCLAFGLYKGLSAGFIISVYALGGGTNFHTAVSSFNFMFSLLVALFFILVCAEAMSFSAFLFKSEESFKSSVSFKNISVYSSRFMLFTILIALATLLQTVAMPLVYAWLG